MQHYTTALVLDQTDLKARGNRCAAALMLKRYSAVVDDAKVILAAEPKNARACARLSKGCLGTGDIPAAVRWATEATKLDCNNAQYRTEEIRVKGVASELKAAHAHLSAGNAAAAAVSARRALSLAGDVPLVDAAVVLARALLQQGKGTEAVQASRGAVQADGSSTAALFVHADALVATGATSSAHHRANVSACVCPALHTNLLMLGCH